MSKHNDKGNNFGPVPPGGRVIQMTESTAENMRRQQYEKVQPHLNELNQENAIEQQAVQLVFAAQIRHGGVGEAIEHYDLCMQLAQRLAKQAMRTAREKARDLFIELNFTEVPVHIARASARAGVEMPTSKVLVDGEKASS